MTRPLLLGHRGARGDKTVPENTLVSFDRALADGCDGFEFDVRLTCDGEAVVCHDPRVGKVEVGRASADLLSDLPRLRDVLKRYQQNAFLDIELKVGGLEEIAVALLTEFPPSRGFVVSSFLPEVLTATRAANSEIPLGLICENRVQLKSWCDLPIQYLIPERRLASWELVADLKSAGKKVMVWTVNNPSEMKKFAEWGVHGLISDDTHLLAMSLGG